MRDASLYGDDIVSRRLEGEEGITSGTEDDHIAQGVAS
jgi:hypothetical protein